MEFGCVPRSHEAEYLCLSCTRAQTEDCKESSEDCDAIAEVREYELCSSYEITEERSMVNFMDGRQSRGAEIREEDE